MSLTPIWQKSLRFPAIEFTGNLISDEQSYKRQEW